MLHGFLSEYGPKQEAKKGRHRRDALDEELNTPERVGKADEPLKGVDVSVSEDADSEVDEVSDSVEVVEAVDDGTPSLRSGTRTGRDTLGNASPTAVRAALAAAGISRVVRAAGSVPRIWTLVTAPVASM